MERVVPEVGAKSMPVLSALATVTVCSVIGPNPGTKAPTFHEPLSA